MTFGIHLAASDPMYVPLVFATALIGLCAALVAWYYNRAFQTVRCEYLGSSRSSMSGRADDVYDSLVRPLRVRRLIALGIASAATAGAVLLVGLHRL
jgi:hypothetical protein